MFSEDRDVIMTAAGGVNQGAITEAMEERRKGNEVWIVGVDKDMYEDGIYEEGKSVVLTSAMKSVQTGAINGVQAHFGDNFKGGEVTLGFKDGGADIPTENPNVDDELIKEAYTNFKEVR